MRLTVLQSLLVLCCCLASMVQGSANASSTEVESWLERMQHASTMQNYRGTFVLRRGSMNSSMRVVHTFQSGMEIERLTQLDGAMGEIVRRGGKVMCFFPDNRVVELEKEPFANPVISTSARFMPNPEVYALSVAGEHRLVNRQAVKLNIKARDGHRYSYQLWLDKQTGLLLQFSLQNSEGDELEHFRFIEVDFPERIAAEELEPMTNGKVVAHEVIPPVPVDRSWPDGLRWHVGFVPPGFKAMRDARNPGDNVLVYSDGLASYSVFVERVAENMMPLGASMVGATVAYADKLASKGHHYGVTVVGQIPAMTAMLIAESVRPKEPGSK